MSGRSQWMARLCCALLLAVAPLATRADDAVDVSLSYTADVSLVGTQQGRAHALYLDNLDAIADLDLDELAGWRGAMVHVYVLANQGGRPNDRAMTLEGINNIEVPEAGIRLFEAWIDQPLGRRASLRLGLYDLNSEFYVTEASDLLIAPPFGIGTELSASGPNGPSIFPSSALAVRAKVAIGRTGSAQIAVVNADARTLGDAGGADLSFRQGALVIGEVARGERLRWTLGGWFYTRTMPVIDPARPDDRAPSFGGYAMLQWRLGAGSGARQTYLFARGGVSDGATSPVVASLQLGLFVRQPFAGRPDSAFSVGVHRGWRSTRYRDVIAAVGRPAHGETGFELTYADQPIAHVTLQPDLQVILNPGADLSKPAAVIAQLRTIVSF